MAEKSASGARLCWAGFDAWERLTPSEVCALCHLEDPEMIISPKAGSCPCLTCPRGGKHMVAAEDGAPAHL